MVPLCCQRREMNDDVDVKRTVAKQKVDAEFDLATLKDVSSNTSTLVSFVGMPPLVQAQQWFGVTLYTTVWEDGLNTVGRLNYNICLASANQICIFVQS